MGNALVDGREAAARYAWREALDLLVSVDAADLTPDDCDLLAESAWWMGKMRDCIAARERAYAAYLAAGDVYSAADAALKLFDHHNDLGETGLSMAWLQNASRLLEGQEERVQHGNLALQKAMASAFAGDKEGALVGIKQARLLGQRFASKDLIALSLALEGMLLVRGGEVDEGVAALEEATVPAVSGELGPFATGLIYCMMITATSAVGDWQRAGQWTEAAKRWCDRQAISGFPGVCRVHRAEVMRLRGALADAEVEATAATIELGTFNIGIAASAFRELGDIRLRTGDLDGAEEAFRQANELGALPQPGLATIQFFRGKPEAAVSSLKRALADETMDRLERAKLLPALAEFSVAIGDLTGARAAAQELEQIAGVFSSTAIRASFHASSALVALAEGDMTAAENDAKRARRLWRETDVLYEAARTSVLLGDVYLAEGDRDGATFEYTTALSTFEKFGAALDADVVRARLAAVEVAPEPTGKRVAKTFLFSDIVRSTNLVEAIGDEAWTDLLKWHDELLRSRFSAHGGEEVAHTGDGFFVAFETADEAIACAVGIQRALVEHRRAHGFAPQVRIGVHSTEAAEAGGNYHGKGVHEAARIGALAEGGEILVSASSLECIARPVSMSEVREVALKGVTEPVRIVSLQWKD